MIAGHVYGLHDLWLLTCNSKCVQIHSLVPRPSIILWQHWPMFTTSAGGGEKGNSQGASDKPNDAHAVIAISLQGRGEGGRSGVVVYTLLYISHSLTSVYKEYIACLLPRQHHCRRDMSNILMCCLGHRLYRPSWQQQFLIPRSFDECLLVQMKDERKSFQVFNVIYCLLPSHMWAQRRSDTLTDVHGTPYHVW